MKRVYVLGSFRFRGEMEELENELRKERIEYDMSKERSIRGIAGCLEKIDKADIVYVVDPDGYVGRSVCVDIGYALGKGKPVYVMHSVEDPLLVNLVQGVLSFEGLINLVKS